MNGEKARGLVPPRENLGPEPWREPDATPRILVALGVAVVVVLLLAWLWRHRRALAMGRRPTAAGGLAALEPTPRDGLVGLSETLRDALTAQFGNVFRAKTTEELSADDRLVQLLGEESFRELIQFLDQIDLLKFAPERSQNHDGELGEALEVWEPRVTALAARIRVKPKARPRPASDHPASDRARPAVRGVSSNGGNGRPDRG